MLFSWQFNWILKPVYKRKQSAISFSVELTKEHYLPKKSSSLNMKAFLVILIFLAGTVVSFPYTLHSHQLNRRLLNDLNLTKGPPKAKKVKHDMEMFDDVRVDNFFWIRDDNGSNPEVTAYINEENNYTNLIMSGTKKLQDQIFAEVSGQLGKEDDISAPRRRGPYYYYERTLAGTNYYQYCRRRRIASNGGDQPSIYDVMPTEPNSPPEHVMLDERLRAHGQTYYSTGAFRVSPNHSLVAITEDTKGNGNYTAYVIDAETGNPVGKSLIGLTYNVVWAGNEILLYITTDSTSNRADKVWLHKLGEEQSNDMCLYHEKDEKFAVDIELSESMKFVFVSSKSVKTRFVLYLDIAIPKYELMPLTPRIDGIETLVNHRGNRFYIKRTSEDLYNSELLACPIDNVSAITVILPHRESVRITFVQLFSEHLVVFERENGLTKIIVFNLPPIADPDIQMLQRANAIEFMDPDYAIYHLDSDFNSTILRFLYGTLRTPNTVIDYDMNKGISEVKKTDVILGGFDSSNYVTERKWATAPDGIQVPMSIVYKKNLKKLDGSNPLLLYGYASYGISTDPYFSASMLPFLDRGFIYVIGHVRGGGEMGAQWHINGKSLKKKNTFSDFIACAEFLIKMKYCTNEKLVIDGIFGGGLIIAAVINKRPDLFRVAIAEAPFVDVVTRMLVPTIPQNSPMREEWGDPRKEQFYRYMKSYSPYDNISAQKYPSILVTTGYYPTRSISEYVKFVAKLRDLKTDKNLLLFKDLNDGLSPMSWRSEDLRRNAFILTFILKALNMLS